MFEKLDNLPAVTVESINDAVQHRLLWQEPAPMLQNFFLCLIWPVAYLLHSLRIAYLV